MKDFVKFTLASMLGFLIIGIVMFFFSIALIGSLAALGDTKPVMPREAILKVDMSEIILSEQTRETDPFSSIQGETRTNLGIYSAIRAINAAAYDPAIKYLYLKPDGACCGLLHRGSLYTPR